MRKTFRSVGVVLAVSLGATLVSHAQPVQKQGAIGDSISTAMDANDQGLTIFNFLSRLYEDQQYSWTTGDLLTGSFRNRLGVFGNIVRQQANGARWGNALAQATGLTNAGGVTVVTIEMGGNDVCRNLNDFLPSRAEMAVQIDAAFSQLAYGLPPGASVVVAEVPDVVNLHGTTHARSHVVFGTCQNLWNNVLFNFPCGYVLRSAVNDRGETPAFRRALARAFNEELNEEIAWKVATWNGVNGVRFSLSGDTFEYQFTSDEVSRVDCFHPNRTGQANLASLAWRGVGYDGSGYTPRVVHAYAWRPSGDSMRARIYLSQNGQADVFMSNCSNPADPCYGEGAWSCWAGQTEAGGTLDFLATPDFMDPAASYSMLIVPHAPGAPWEEWRWEDTYVSLCRGPGE